MAWEGFAQLHDWHLQDCKLCLGEAKSKCNGSESNFIDIAIIASRVFYFGGGFLFYVLVHLSMYSWSIRFSNEIYMYLACIFQNYPESNFFFFLQIMKYLPTAIFKL